MAATHVPHPIAPVIATSPSLDVLRNGWLDAATTLAPDQPALGELLDQRLRDAVASGRLSEDDLLATVGEVEAAASEAGTPAVTSLAMRLRRTVYEYLLAVDATSAVEAQPGSYGEPPVTAPFHIVDEPEPEAEVADEPVAEEPSPVEPLAAEEPLPAEPVAVDDPVAEEAAAEAPATVDEDPAAVADAFVPVPMAAPGADPIGPAEDADEPVAASHPDDAPLAFEPPANADDGPAHWIQPEPEPAEPAVFGEPDSAPEEPPVPVAASYVAPRDGFHITDDVHVFAEVERAELPPPEADAAAGGWRVRENTAEARRDAAARGDAPRAVAEQPEDPFETDSRLFEERRRIEDRLRKKKCDEAAAMLQSLAQETGGRAIAELAMDAGDRCRGLGKTNAALNCYLAASRADPIYEQPLHRLADICIDDQDIDLAVSYLERIARLHQLRGDSTGALRVYRRIVTVAPYREDILTMLMNARTTGQMPS